jgi:hypothetical protein
MSHVSIAVAAISDYDVPDLEPESLFIITALDLGPKALRALKRRRKKKL